MSKGPYTPVDPLQPVGGKPDPDDDTDHILPWNSYEATLTLKVSGVAQSSEDFFGAVVGVLKDKGLEGTVVDERTSEGYPIVIVWVGKPRVTVKEVEG